MSKIKPIANLGDFITLWLKAASREGTRAYSGQTFIEILYELLKPHLKAGVNRDE